MPSPPSRHRTVSIALGIGAFGLGALAIGVSLDRGGVDAGLSQPALASLVQHAAPPTSNPVPPPKSGVLLGVYSHDPVQFQQTTGKRHPLHAVFVDWLPRSSVHGEWGTAQSQARSADVLEVHWSATEWRPDGGIERLSSGAVAAGAGDAHLLRGARVLRGVGKPVLLRWAAEMNGYWHTYSAFDQDGSRRDAARSTVAYKRAFKRVRIIFRGPTRSAVNRNLKRAGLRSLRAPSGGRVGAPNVAFVWAPNISSNPKNSQNEPSDYYPGDAYVDWVGVDVYDDGSWDLTRPVLDRHYSRHPKKPFIISEWGVVSDSDNPEFINDMFAWMRAHPRVGASQWYDLSEQLQSHDGARAAYSDQIRGSTFLASYRRGQ
jgi:hypothetical protein